MSTHHFIHMDSAQHSAHGKLRFCFWKLSRMKKKQKNFQSMVGRIFKSRTHTYRGPTIIKYNSKGVPSEGIKNLGWEELISCDPTYTLICLISSFLLERPYFPNTIFLVKLFLSRGVWNILLNSGQTSKLSLLCLIILQQFCKGVLVPGDFSDSVWETSQHTGCLPHWAHTTFKDRSTSTELLGWEVSEDLLQFRQGWTPRRFVGCYSCCCTPVLSNRLFLSWPTTAGLAGSVVLEPGGLQPLHLSLHGPPGCDCHTDWARQPIEVGRIPSKTPKL